MVKATHKDGIPRQLTHVSGRELPDLSGNRVLFHERLLGEVELQGVVRREGDQQPTRQVLREGVPMVVEEEGVVGQG